MKLLMLAAALAAASVASAHGDPSTHTLEAENLYPAFANRPSQSVELQLIGLLRAALRTLLLCLLIPALIWDRDGRGLHDKAAGTVVVRAR